MVSHTGLHRRSDAQALVNPAEVVSGEPIPGFNTLIEAVFAPDDQVTRSIQQLRFWGTAPNPG